MVRTGTMKFREEKCVGGKQRVIRCTILVTASLTGEKLPLLVIGKSKNPRCFKNYNTNNHKLLRQSWSQKYLQLQDTLFRHLLSFKKI